MVYSPVKSIGRSGVNVDQGTLFFSTDISMGNLGTVTMPHGRDATRLTCNTGVEVFPHA